MSDWRDDAIPDRDGFGLGGLQDGEALVVGFLDDGRGVETEHGKAVQWGVNVLDAPDGLTDMSGEEIVEYSGAEDDPEYNLMSSSNRLAYQLAGYADSLEGETVKIEAVGAPDSFDRTYTVEEA